MKTILITAVLLSGCSGMDSQRLANALYLTAQQQAAYTQARVDGLNAVSLAQAGRSNQASAPMMGSLTGQAENGSLRYCRYSNGVVTTINITSLCPLSN